LKERDGIPLLVQNTESTVDGVLINFKQGKRREAYKRITEVEPDKVYRWETILIQNGLSANCLLGRSPNKGSSDLEYWTNWDGQTDPFFKEALEEVESIIVRDKNELLSDHRALFRLQMAYMLLWSSIERYAGFRYHLGQQVVEKVNQIADEKCFIESFKKNVKEKREVIRSTDLKKYTLDPDNPKKSIMYYYQVRSNVVHRGKSVNRDFRVLRLSLEELFMIFKDMLNEAWRIS